MSWRKPVILKEIKISNVCSKDKVLNIGCGVFPSSSVIIAEKTKAQVTSIDKNKSVLKIAKKFVEKRGLSDYIDVRYGDGIDFDTDGFDVIFISVNVWPIDLVLENLVCKIDKDVRIICRSKKDSLYGLFSNSSLSNHFSIEQKTVNPYTYSFLLFKK